MSAYSTGRVRLGDQDIVILTDAVRQRRLRIACHGAVVIGFEVLLDGVMHDLVDGHGNADEIVRRPGSRFAIMAPFAGRIDDARYVFDGVKQDLQPGVAGDARASRHGFVRDTTFAIETLDADEHGARATLTTTIDPQPGYPHRIALSINYRLDASGFTLEARMRNVGEQVAPCFFGWHPYFRLANGLLDDWQLQIPAETVIRTNADLIAFPGTAACVSLDDAPALDFREPRAIGDSVLDQGYTDLQTDDDGRIRTRLQQAGSDRGIAIWQERGVMHAFTGDSLSDGARRSIALEPMECMANAFNRDDCAEAIRLPPGVERIFRCGVEVEL